MSDFSALNLLQIWSPFW